LAKEVQEEGVHPETQGIMEMVTHINKLDEVVVICLPNTVMRKAPEFVDDGQEKKLMMKLTVTVS
jgi:hypothetical protein